MYPVPHPIQTALRIARPILDALLGMVIVAELWLRRALTTAGLSPALQDVALIVLAVVLVLAILRAAGGLLKLVLVAVIGLMIARAAGFFG